MAKIFNRVSNKKPKRNVFDLSHERKFSMNMGDLVPIFCQEVVPGDTFRMNTEILMRLAPMTAPMMHRVDVYTHFFFVPNRLVWTEWEKFITGGDDGSYQGDFAPVFPYFSSPSSNAVAWYNQYVKSGTLMDYLGLPIPSNTGSVNAEYRFSALPFRAYRLIYEEYYRDQNLMSKYEFSKSSGRDTDYELFKLMKRCWEKDYFTSCLPYAQKGYPVRFADGDVYYSNPNRNQAQRMQKVDGTNFTGTASALSHSSATTQTAALQNAQGQLVNLDPNGTLKAPGITISDFRRAISLQKWLEKNARSGSRYTEFIKSHYGVKSSDARLQRPEYLGGGKSPIRISEVLQHSESNNTPQGTMSGHGISAGNSNSFKRFFEEHGMIIGLVSVLPRTTYQQGLPRFFSKDDPFDFYFPEFAHIGEQEVLNKELLMTSYSPTYNDAVFGYQSRYAEYKYIPSTVHGDFKGNMDFWHMGRKFSESPGAYPALNPNFVTADPTHRVFAVDDPAVHKLWVQCYNNVQAIRPIPFFSDPS